MHGAGWWQTLGRILIALAWPAFAVGWVLIFFGIMRELSASILLYAPGTEVLSVVMLKMWVSGKPEEVSVIGLVMLVLVLLFRWVQLGSSRSASARSERANGKTIGPMLRRRCSWRCWRRARRSAGRAAAQSDDWQKVVEAAKKEGKLVIYTASIGSPFHKAVVKAFEQKYGIRVELLEARASEVRERVRVEQAAGRFLGDIHHNGSTTTWLMTRDGNFQPHGAIPNIKNIVPPYEADDIRVPAEVISYGLLVNRNLVKPADEPKSWKDILDPRWTGKILSDDYRALGGGAVFFVVMHDTFGKEFHEKLAAQKPVFSRDIAQQRAARGARRVPALHPVLAAGLQQPQGPAGEADRARRRPALCPLRPDGAQERAASQRGAAVHEPLSRARTRRSSSPTPATIRWSRAWSRRPLEEIRPLLATKALGTTDARAPGRHARTRQADLQVAEPRVPSVTLHAVGRHFAEVKAVDGIDLADRARRVRHAARAVGLRQDHDPAHGGGAGAQRHRHAS